MKKPLVLAVVMAIAPCAATAGELDYTYAEASYARLAMDVGPGADFKLGGMHLRGSALVSENVYLFGHYGLLRGGYHGGDFDHREIHLGAGYRHPIASRIDLIAELAAWNHKVSGASYGTADGTAARANMGVRGRIADRLEGTIKAGFVGGGDSDTAYVFVAGAQYRFNDTWGLSGEVETAKNSVRSSVGVRASF